VFTVPVSETHASKRGEKQFFIKPFKTFSNNLFDKTNSGVPVFLQVCRCSFLKKKENL
jgi:hypothetical protein